MPSQLIDLVRRMTWNDFPNVKAVPPPGPDRPEQAAEFEPLVRYTPWRLQVIPGSAPPKYRYGDNLTVRIVFDPAKSWQADWLNGMPQAQKDQLLEHEQGHYNIAALIGRDFFLDAMRLKSKVYGASKPAEKDFDDIHANTLAKLDGAQEKYEKETKHGFDAAAQSRWTMMINTAFTSPRSPPATAADGVPLKARLLDVLRANGILL